MRRKRTSWDVYIAGSMMGRLGRDVMNERAHARKLCEQLGLSYYDPSLDEAITPDEVMDTDPSMRRMRWFVEKDFRHLDRCRALIDLNGDRSSSGKGWECARMVFKHKRPIVLVAPRMCDRSLVNFSTILATKVCATQGEAFRWLKYRLHK